MVYDGNRHLIGRLVDGQTTGTVLYDTAGHYGGFTDPLGNTTTVVNDALGRPLTKTTPDGATTTTVYDAAGLVVSTTAPGGVTTSYAYDGAGRQTAVIKGYGSGSASHPGLLRVESRVGSRQPTPPALQRRRQAVNRSGVPHVLTVEHVLLANELREHAGGHGIAEQRQQLAHLGARVLGLHREADGVAEVEHDLLSVSRVNVHGAGLLVHRRGLQSREW